MGSRPTALSYSHGAVDDRVARWAAIAGFTVGAMSRLGINRAGISPLRLCRTEIVRDDSLGSFRGKVRGDYDWYQMKQRLYWLLPSASDAHGWVLTGRDSPPGVRPLPLTRDRSLLAALFVVGAGVLVRLVVTLGAVTEVETWEYEVIARNLLAGRGFGIHHLGTWYRTYGSPPFAYLCALLYGVFGPHQGAVLVSQWAFSAATTMGSYLIGRRLFSPGVGVAAAALVAFHPGILFYDTHKLHPLGLDAALILWSVGGLLWLEAGLSRRGAAGLGILHGVGLLERTTLLGLPVAALAWIAGARRAPRARLATAYLLGFLLALAPWLGRSLSIYGSPIITSTTPELLWRGNNPLADGGSFARGHPGVPVISLAPQELQERLYAADEAGQREIFTAAASEFIREHPWEALRLFLGKLRGFWWFMPQTGVLYPPAYLRIYRMYYVVVALSALVGVVVALSAAPRRVRWGIITVLGMMLSVSLVHAAFYVEMRHRWGVEPLLLVFTAGGSAALLGRVRSMRPRMETQPDSTKSVSAAEQA